MEAAPSDMDLLIKTAWKEYVLHHWWPQTCKTLWWWHRRQCATTKKVMFFLIGSQKEGKPYQFPHGRLCGPLHSSCPNLGSDLHASLSAMCHHLVLPTHLSHIATWVLGHRHDSRDPTNQVQPLASKSKQKRYWGKAYKKLSPLEITGKTKWLTSLLSSRNWWWLWHFKGRGMKSSVGGFA